LDGLAIFVPYTAPGDKVEVKITERKDRFARAELLRVLEPGLDVYNRLAAIIFDYQTLHPRLSTLHRLLPAGDVHCSI
jgi:hypothetical protein